MQKGYIYSLTCPIENVVRYVGRTVCPSERYKQHLWSANNVKIRNKELAEWIKYLAGKNLKPYFEILAECTYREQSDMEQYFINIHIVTGRLLNRDRLIKLHEEIDYIFLRGICKKKKIRYKIIAAHLNVAYCSVAGYLTGERCQLNLEKAKKLRDYILSV